jgi:predicted ATPase/DNA-binding SARP family transcriptional activator
MEFRILGSFEVVGTDGVLDVRGAKRRSLLACLVVHAGQPLSSDRLVEELWGDRGSDGAVRTVQTYVSQLRRLLAGQTASLVTRPGGYTLEVEPAGVDAHRFERAVTAAGAEPDPARRLDVLDEALALWRGPALGEFVGAGWADRAARPLEALHLQALQRRCDTLVDLDRPGEAVAELDGLVGAHPLDETLWARLMRALYRSGRQADALGAYKQARHHLIEELGIEPGPQLAELEHRILDQDPTLVAPGVPPIAEHRVGAHPTADGWRLRTFLLTDIVDSASLWERDPAGMSKAVARHDTIIREAVVGAGGELVRLKGEGDSRVSVFVQPSQALAVAASVHEALASEPWPSTIPLRVRAGVHTGKSEARDADWYGPAVSRAARLRAVADGGQTLVSGVTAGLVADQLPNGVGVLYRGRRMLRGIERPEEVWEMVAADSPGLAAATPAGPGGLPVSLNSFVGHGEDLEHLADVIEEERLVTVTGPGGGGKTRLALELAGHASRRGRRVSLAELAPLRDAGLVAPVVATAVGVQVGRDPLDELLAQPDALSGLLVLDNCEHLLDPCAALIEQLLAAGPELHVLATSREPLGLAGEREWPIRPLDLPDDSQRDCRDLAKVESVQLLLDRARAVRPDLEVGDDDLASLVHICRALDGLPLAIELAAGRLRSLSLADLATRLGKQVAVLARNRPAGRDEARHQTLRMTLDWSYDLLSDEQRTLAQRLSVFRGGFRLDAVEAVCGSDIDVLDGIDELVAKSMVTFDGLNTRYRMLEPLRQYLAEHLEESGATEGVRRAHAQWVADLCDRLGNWLLEDRKHRSHRLGEETGNIDQALRWAHDHDAATAIRIVGSLGPYWYSYDPASGRRWCDVVVETAAAAAPRARARALLSAGMMAFRDQHGKRSVALFREALAIYREQASATGQAASLFFLGWAIANSGDLEHRGDRPAEPTRCFEESLRLFTRLGNWVGVGWCLGSLSAHAYRKDDLDQSERLANQVIEECTAAGARQPVGLALWNLAFVAHRRGRDDAALELLHDAAAVFRDLDDLGFLAGLLVDLAAQEAAAGRGAEALQTLAESARLGNEIGGGPGRTHLLAVAAVVHLARGQPALAVAALGSHDAHPAPPRPPSGYVGWPTDSVEAMKAQLDAAEVAAATIAARHKSLDELIDELILQPAQV